MMIVALATPVPLGSWIEPLTLPERCCAVRRRAARGSRNVRVRKGTRNFVLAARVRRLIDGFSIAANLLSRLDGRAIAREVDQARPEFSIVLAGSGSSLAEWDGATPERRTPP